MKSRSAISPYTITSVSSSGGSGERGRGGRVTPTWNGCAWRRWALSARAARGRADAKRRARRRRADGRACWSSSSTMSLATSGRTCLAPRDERSRSPARTETASTREGRNASPRRAGRLLQDLRLRALRRVRDFTASIIVTDEEAMSASSRAISETTEAREVVCRPRRWDARPSSFGSARANRRALPANAVTTLRCRPSGSARAPRAFFSVSTIRTRRGAPRHDRLRSQGYARAERLRSRVRRPGRNTRRPPAAGGSAMGGGGRPRNRAHRGRSGAG